MKHGFISTMLLGFFIVNVLSGVFELYDGAREHHRAKTVGFPEVTYAADFSAHIGGRVKITNTEMQYRGISGEYIIRNRFSFLGAGRGRRLPTYSHYLHTLQFEDAPVAFISRRIIHDGTYDGYVRVLDISKDHISKGLLERYYERPVPQYAVVSVSRDDGIRSIKSGILAICIGFVFGILYLIKRKREKKQYTAKQAKLAATQAQKLRAAKLNQPPVNRPQRPRPK